MYCTCLYGAGRNDFDADNIHYKGPTPSNGPSNGFARIKSPSAI